MTICGFNTSGRTVTDDLPAITCRGCRTAPASILATTPEPERPGVTLTRDQLEAWATRPLTDDEIGQLDDCIPNSSIPDAIATIADQF